MSPENLGFEGVGVLTVSVERNSFLCILHKKGEKKKEAALNTLTVWPWFVHRSWLSYPCASPGAAVGAMLCLRSRGCVEPRCSPRAPVVPGCPLPLALTAICLSLLTSKQHKHSPSTRRYRELAGRAARGENRFEFSLNYMLSERRGERDKYHTGM